MDRREFLAAVGGCLSFGAAGCLGDADTGNDGAGESPPEATGTAEPADGDEVTESTAAGTPDYVGDIWIFLQNHTDVSKTVRLTVSATEETIREAERRIAPGAGSYVDPEIDEIGEYELLISVDGGPERSSPLRIEDYDIRMGSNVIVWIREESFKLLKEE